MPFCINGFMIADTVIVRTFPGLQDYNTCWQAMKAFTNQRTEETIDELWIVEHQPVFTQGQNGKAEHVLNPGTIPIVQSDRGGQVTYHGPGQIMAYILVDVKRKKLNIRELVTHLEKSVIELLAQHQIEAKARCDAPGVYVDDKKICSVGLRIRRGSSYHGLALNVDMDLEPFSRINPCGYAGLEMTQLTELAGPQDIRFIGSQLIECLIANLGYTTRLFKPTI
jgi:lipoyl(octanoyl) transferase